MFTINCRGKLIVAQNPMIMGIINVTPDSFYKGSRMPAIKNALHKIGLMVKEGADIIDIGGQSTRPGSERISIETELNRVIPVLKEACSLFPDTLFSIDTYQSVVAIKAIEAGASIVNDISGGDMDNQMLRVVASLKTPLICMHMKGNPANMQKSPTYKDLPKEILDYFIKKIHQCNDLGIKDIVIDPGFGFGKTITHNFQLLKSLALFKMFEKPIMVGLSRKSTIYKTLGISAEESLNGSTVLNTMALMNGASLLRVHDVAPAKQLVKLYSKYNEV